MSPEFSVLSVANFKAADRPAIPDPRIRTWGVRGGTERSFKREWDGVMLPLMRGYIALGTARQDRTRSIHHRFLLLALITFSVVMGMIFVESRRSSVIARARQASESRELDERFVRGSDHLEARLDELKTQSRHAVTTGDRHRLPLGVVSVSSWARTPTGIVRTFGFEAEGVWEQALYRVLPAEIAKHQSPAVLPLVGPGLLNDPSAETLRLGFFPEKEGAEITVIAFRPSVLFAGFLGNDATKRYLIEESGLVLAHTNASAVIPPPQEVELPALLGKPSPRLRAYRRETTIAEKCQALVMLGMTNTRMKDFYDLWYLSTAYSFDGELLSSAMQATFTRRRTEFPPDGLPLALTDEFANDSVKQSQWNAFLGKASLRRGSADWTSVIQRVRTFLQPPLRALARGLAFEMRWSPRDGWGERQ